MMLIEQETYSGTCMIFIIQIANFFSFLGKKSSKQIGNLKIVRKENAKEMIIRRKIKNRFKLNKLSIYVLFKLILFVYF